MSIKIHFKIILLSCFALIYSSFLFANPNMSKGKVTSVYSYDVGVKKVSQSLSLVGKLEADQSVDVATEVTGKIIYITSKENKGVTRGELLLKIDDRKARALLHEASAYLKDEQRKLRELNQLVKRNAVTQTAADSQQAVVDIAKARYELANVEFDNHSIIAPFSGMLGLVNFSEGKLVQAGDKLLTLDTLSRMRLDLQVPERYLSQLEAGLSVSVTTSAWGDKTFTGKIVAINSRINPETLNLRVRIEFENKKTQLKPGMLVLANVDFPAVDVLIIPVQALEYSGTKRFVYVINDGVVKRTEVKLGERIKNQVLITDGLNKGESIVIQGLVKIRDGGKVNVLKNKDSM